MPAPPPPGVSASLTGVAAVEGVSSCSGGGDYNISL